MYFDYPGNDDDSGCGVHGFDCGVQVARYSVDASEDFLRGSC